MNEYLYYVNGEWKKTESTQTITIKSPYKDNVVGCIQAITKQEVDAVMNSAKQALKEWSELTIQERGVYLNRWADCLLKTKNEIAQTVMNEVGKTYADALKEVERTAELIKYTVEEAIHLTDESMRGEQFPSGSAKKLAIIKRSPLGVVLAVSPFNYPVNLAAAKIAPALIMGNTVVLKPATQGAISGIKMIEAIHETNIPAGVINLVTGKGSEIGDYLTSHELVDMITFTGGTQTGEHLSSQSKMVPLVLELGGKDPAIICEDANLNEVVKEIMSGAFSYSAQRCTAIKRILVLDEVADELVTRLKKEVESLTVGSPEDNAVIVPLIDNKSADFVQSLIDDAIEKGAKAITEIKRDGNLIYPVLLDHVTKEMKIAWEEPFGPVLPVIRVSSVEEAIKIANESEYGLQASVFSENINTAMNIAAKIEAGTVQINGRTERGPDHFPFLGIKKSGLGVQGVKGSILSMSTEKVLVINVKEAVENH